MEQPPPPVALSIAGSDPTGAAGIQLDLRVFAALGVHGMAVPTALTVQSTSQVHTVLPAFPSVVGDQLLAVLRDIVPDAIKLGMLATDDVLLRVATLLEAHDVPLVLDPVLRASDGSTLLEPRAFGSLMKRIVPRATLVTPNLDECELLVGSREPERAAELWLESGARAVLVKAGHAEGPPDDLLRTPDRTVWLEGRRQPLTPRGTGCALASAIAAKLAGGTPLERAVREGKAFVDQAIRGAFRAGSGGAALLRIPSAGPGAAGLGG